MRSTRRESGSSPLLKRSCLAHLLLLSCPTSPSKQFSACLRMPQTCPENCPTVHCPALITAPPHTIAALDIAPPLPSPSGSPAASQAPLHPHLSHGRFGYWSCGLHALPAIFNFIHSISTPYITCLWAMCMSDATQRSRHPSLLLGLPRRRRAGLHRFL